MKTALRSKTVSIISLLVFMSGLVLNVHAGTSHHSMPDQKNDTSHQRDANTGHDHHQAQEKTPPGDDTGNSKNANCCHVTVCSAGTSALPMSWQTCARDASAGSSPIIESRLTAGLQHAPPLRPPRT